MTRKTLVRISNPLQYFQHKKMYQQRWWALRNSALLKSNIAHIHICTYWKYHLGEFLIYEGRTELQMNGKSKIPATLVHICF